MQFFSLPGLKVGFFRSQNAAERTACIRPLRVHGVKFARAAIAHAPEAAVYGAHAVLYGALRELKDRTLRPGELKKISYEVVSNKPMSRMGTMEKAEEGGGREAHHLRSQVRNTYY